MSSVICDGRACAVCVSVFLFFFFNDTATPEIYTLSLHDALPIWARGGRPCRWDGRGQFGWWLLHGRRSEEHTSELQSQFHLVCRLLLEKKKIFKHSNTVDKPSVSSRSSTARSLLYCCSDSCDHSV